MKRSMFAGLALACLVLVAGAAASQPAGGGAVRRACAADVKTLCAGVQPGGGRLLQCLRENRDKVSDACKSAAAQMRAARREGQGAAPAPAN